MLLDGEKISRVIHNLVNNACKYTPDNEKIAILVAHIDGEAIFQIMDNGKGLPRENRQRLLEPYMTTREKGTGLGLAIVKKIVEDHGGRLELNDAPPGFHGGRGAMISMILPAAPAAPTAERPEAERKTEKVSDGV